MEQSKKTWFLQLPKDILEYINSFLAPVNCVMILPPDKWKNYLNFANIMKLQKYNEHIITCDKIHYVDFCFKDENMNDFKLCIPIKCKYIPFTKYIVIKHEQHLMMILYAIYYTLKFIGANADDDVAKLKCSLLQKMTEYIPGYRDPNLKDIIRDINKDSLPRIIQDNLSDCLDIYTITQSDTCTNSIECICNLDPYAMHYSVYCDANGKQLPLPFNFVADISLCENHIILDTLMSDCDDSISIFLTLQNKINPIHAQFIKMIVDMGFDFTCILQILNKCISRDLKDKHYSEMIANPAETKKKIIIYQYKII